MLYQTLTALALFTAASGLPQYEVGQCPRTVCVDAVNSCGVRYGDCYDDCLPRLAPSAPSCSSSDLPISTDDCSTRTVCADYVNECGIWYGGCFPDCTPWPTFTAPPCTTSTPSTTSSVTLITPAPTSEDCHTQTVCADYINECGQTYGGCFSACTPWPTFTAPPCPTTPVTTETICYDYFKTCTQGTSTEVLTYGGCFPYGGPVPTFSEPPCPTATTTPTVIIVTPSATPTTICRDYFKTCTEGTSTAVLTYGGCYELGGPTPTFSEPSCPTATATSDT